MTDYQADYERSHALVMGVDSYRNLNPLSAAVRGARALAETLSDRYDFEVTLLTDGQVKRDSVFDWLNELAHEAGPDDRVLIYFAGHGLTRGMGLYERGYLGLRDSEPEKWHSLLAMDDIIDEARFIKAKHLLYLLDCCFGGLALETRAVGDVPRELEYYLTRPVRYAITAGGKEVVDDALAPGFEYSLFTHHLLEWLSSERIRPPGGIWRARELGNYLERVVARDRRSGHKPNHNYLSGSGDGDFLFTWVQEDVGYVTAGMSSAMRSTSWQVRQGAVAAMIDMAKEEDPDRSAYALRWLERVAREDENEEVRAAANTFLVTLSAEPDPHPVPDTDEIQRPPPELIPVPRAMDEPPVTHKRGFGWRWGVPIGGLVASILAGLEPVINGMSPWWLEFASVQETPLAIAGAVLMLGVGGVDLLARRWLRGALALVVVSAWTLGYLYDPILGDTFLADILWPLRWLPYALTLALLGWQVVGAALSHRGR